jgi:hypothetical protein
VLNEELIHALTKANDFSREFQNNLGQQAGTIYAQQKENIPILSKVEDIEKFVPSNEFIQWISDTEQAIIKPKDLQELGIARRMKRKQRDFAREKETENDFDKNDIGDID